MEGHETRVKVQPQKRFHHLSLDVTELNKDIMGSSPLETPQPKDLQRGYSPQQLWIGRDARPHGNPLGESTGTFNFLE